MAIHWPSRGPFTVVETCFSEQDCCLPELEETVWRAALRDKAWRREDWEGEPHVFGLEPEVQVPADGFGQGESSRGRFRARALC